MYAFCQLSSSSISTHNVVVVLLMECRLLASDTIDEETGDLRAGEDREHRQVSERDKLRVIWNTERRCYFDSSGVKRSRVSAVCTFRAAKNRASVSALGRKGRNVHWPRRHLLHDGLLAPVVV